MLEVPPDPAPHVQNHAFNDASYVPAVWCLYAKCAFLSGVGEILQASCVVAFGAHRLQAVPFLVHGAERWREAGWLSSR